VRLADGREHTEEIIAPKGESENPMSRLDVEEKFLGLAAPVVGDVKSRAVIKGVSSLDWQNSVAPLLATLSVVV
jgi:2-methylcitrate dehydratase PrpD